MNRLFKIYPRLFGENLKDYGRAKVYKSGYVSPLLLGGLKFEYDMKIYAKIIVKNQCDLLLNLKKDNYDFTFKLRRDRL